MPPCPSCSYARKPLRGSCDLKQLLGDRIPILGPRRTADIERFASEAQIWSDLLGEGASSACEHVGRGLRALGPYRPTQHPPKDGKQLRPVAMGRKLSEFKEVGPVLLRCLEAQFIA